MTRRRTAAHLRGNILDAPPGQGHLEGLTVLQRASLTPAQRRGPQQPICACRPPEANRLGGQRPMLRWSGPEALEAYCGTCQRPLQPGIHRRRAATHVMGLAALPLEALDLEDLVAAGLLMEHPPRPAADVTGNADAMPPTRRRRTTTAAAVLSDVELAELRQLAEPPNLEALLADDPLEGLLRGL